jgi:phosphoenolpyruvate carboxylase
VTRNFSGIADQGRQTDRLDAEIFGRIREEFERSVRGVLAVSGPTALLEHPPVLAESIRLRNPYAGPLNCLQTRLLAARGTLASTGGSPLY